MQGDGLDAEIGTWRDGQSLIISDGQHKFRTLFKGIEMLVGKRRISLGVTALTGISQAMVDGQPTFADQFPAARRLLDGAALLGHNIRFDLSFLIREFRRAGDANDSGRHRHRDGSYGR